MIAVEQAATLPPLPDDAMFELMIQQQERRDLKRHRWKRARRLAVAALRVDPRNRTARKIKRQAEVRMRREMANPNATANDMR